MKNNILNYSIDDLNSFFESNNKKAFLSKQVYDWIYKKRVFKFSDMLNISKENRIFLEENFELNKLETIIEQKDKIDGTRKFLFKLNDGNKIETVLMKFNYGYSVCVTSQVGCNMGCKFCASGLLKKIRNLEAWEIVAQVLTIQSILDKEQKSISNIVVMGIGEPFDNFENVSKFLKIVNNDFGLQIGQRKITVSTCGLVNKFEEFANRHPQTGLAISLHAPNDEIRNKLMPINKAFNISKLIEACSKYVNTTNRRITFEYILLDGINDSKENALELVRLVRNINCYVNLIPYNTVSENGFKRSENIKNFFDILNKNRIIATIRQEKGNNIDAACGQLRAKNV